MKRGPHNDCAGRDSNKHFPGAGERAPNYEAYLAHCKAVHPDVPAMSEEAFFRFAIDRRYNKPGGGMRCC